MTLWTWSETASNNDVADPTINWRSGLAPSIVKNSARAMMAAAAKYRDDISGSLVTTGISSAYAITSNQNLTVLTDGFMVAFRPHTTNAAGATLAVDGLTAKPLRSATGVSVPAGALVQGTPYRASYFAAADEWVLHEFFGNLYGIMLGGLMLTTDATPPNSNFVLPYGQAISRTTYAAYFARVGTTFGVGDGSTTFNVLDLRGRTIIGQDNMGGVAAGRVTTAGSGIDGTTIGAAGGAEKVMLARSALPNTTLGGTTDNPGNHQHTTSMANGGGTYQNNTGVFGTLGNAGATAAFPSSAAGAHTHVVITESMNGGVSQTPVNNMQPAIVLPMLLRVI